MTVMAATVDRAQVLLPTSIKLGDKVLGGFVGEDGKWAIRPQWDRVGPFTDKTGLAAVKKDGVWSYVNTSGETVIKLDADVRLAGSFSEGKAWVMNGQKKFGCIDETGQWIIPPAFEDVRNFSQGYAVVRRLQPGGLAECRMVTPEGRESQAFLCEADQASLGWFSEGMAWVRMLPSEAKDKTYWWGYLGLNGKMQIQGGLGSWKRVSDFSAGLGLVQLSSGEYQYLDKEGQVRVKGSWDRAQPFYEGRFGAYAAVCKEGSWWFINREGKAVRHLGPGFTEVMPIPRNPGYYAVRLDTASKSVGVGSVGPLGYTPVVGAEYDGLMDMDAGYALMTFRYQGTPMQCWIRLSDGKTLWMDKKEF